MLLLGAATALPAPLGDSRRPRPRRPPVRESPRKLEELLAGALAAADDGRHAEALEATAELLAQDPFEAKAYFVQGLVQLAAGASSEAVVSLRRAVYIDPRFSLASFTLGRAYDELGEPGDARRAYEQTLGPRSRRQSARRASAASRSRRRRRRLPCENRRPPLRNSETSAMSGKTVLVIDDSETVRATVSDRLERGGYTVASAPDGHEGLRRLYEVKPDVVLLDVVMPELDGWRTLELIRDVSDVPVIMLTSRDSELERVRGLRSGADDYVGKPFSPAELSARIEAVLRRAGEKTAAKELYDDGTVCIDFAARSVTVRDETVSLTPLEFRLLAALTEHTGQVLSRQQLIDCVGAVRTSRAAIP